MKKRSIAIYSLAVFTVLAVGCGTGLRLEGYAKDFYPVTERIQAGDWETADIVFAEEYGEILEDIEEDDFLLALIESATIDYMNGEYSSSERKFLKADSLINFVRGVEFSEEISAFLTSDLALSYKGSDYEQVLVNYYLMKIYIQDNDIESALVECRAVNEKLELFNDRYSDDRANRYSDDAYIQYITGVLYERSGDEDDALVSYRNSLAVYEEQYSNRYEISPPEMVARDVIRLSHDLGLLGIEDECRNRWPNIETDTDENNCDNIMVVIEEGLAPPRYELEIEAAEGIEFRLPIIHDNDVEVDSLYPVFNLVINNTRYSAELVQDVGLIARENLEDQRSRHMLRCLGSEVLRGLARDAVSQVSRGFGLAGLIAGAVLNQTVFNKEETDLRGWLTLPGRIYLTSVPIEDAEELMSVLMGDSLIALSRSDIRGSIDTGIIFLRI